MEMTFSDNISKNIYFELKLDFPFLLSPFNKEINLKNQCVDSFNFDYSMLMLMQIKAENEQFVPFPGFGMNQLTSMVDIKSIAFGPTLNLYKSIKHFVNFS